MLQQRRQLGFAKNATGLDVGQQMLEVAHTGSQCLHFTQPLVHLLQPVGHLLETLAQTRLQRGLQFLIHRGTHLVELGRIGGLQLRQLFFQRFAHFAHAPCIGLAHARELRGQRIRQCFLQQRQLLPKGIDLRVLRARGFSTLLHQ